jgi:pimeloyl-ACP methyl ester carboxylesterase
MTIFLIFLLALLLISAGTWYAYSICFYSPASRRVTPEEPLKGAQYDAVCEHIFRMTHIMEKIPFEEVSVVSHDGLKLYGRYYHVKDGAPIELLFHGYRSHPYRDCSGGHALSRKMGFNALVVDQRAHGASEGNTISFGILERWDVSAWIQYCTNRFGDSVPIILSGLSMGAATVLMAADCKLPANVKCIIADSPYSTPKAIIEKVCHDEHYPLFLCRPFFRLGAYIFGKFNLEETSALAAVKRATVPILLIHGEDDRFVPCSMTHEIATECNSYIEVQTFRDAGHGLCYINDPGRYEKVIYDFLCRIPEIKDAISKSFSDQLFRQ